MRQFLPDLWAWNWIWSFCLRMGEFMYQRRLNKVICILAWLTCWVILSDLVIRNQSPKDGFFKKSPKIIVFAQNFLKSSLVVQINSLVTNSQTSNCIIFSLRLTANKVSLKSYWSDLFGDCSIISYFYESKILLFEVRLRNAPASRSCWTGWWRVDNVLTEQLR